MRKRKWILVVAPLGLAIFIAIGGELVMHLWNWLLPALFGFGQITFWQALGLLALCRILFGGFGGYGPPRWSGRRQMMERCERMTPEERAEFRQRLHDRWGPVTPDSKPTNPPQTGGPES